MKPNTKGDKMIPALAANDVGFQLLLAHPDERVRDFCKAKAACTSWPLHQAKVKSLIAQAKCSDGRLRVPLRYYAAHTGRPGGTQKINLLNLGGKGRGKAIHPLISEVRHTLLAPEGHTLVICDSAQIEARELAWISGQVDLVEDFATGGDPYSKLASELFGEPVWKPSKEEEKTPEGQRIGIMRGFGKDGILLSGYGGGARLLYNRCRQNATLRPLFDSGEYGFDLIDRLIKLYRSKYNMIPKFWKKIEKCFRWVTKYPNETSEYYIPDYLQAPILRGVTLRFWREGSNTIMQLPSGRRMFYRHAVVDRDNNLRDIHGKIYGGLLTENAIQAICRDLLVGWLFECEKNDIPILLYPYDELVGCVPEYRAEEALERMESIMCTTPDWATGLPLGVDKQISRCFTK